MLLRLITCRPTFHILRSPCLLRNSTLLRQNIRQFAKDSTKSVKSSENLFISRTLTLALGLGSSLLIKSRFAGVQCEVSRTRDMHVAVQSEVKFDWRRLWKYLKVHIFKLLGAIVAALVVAYLNINIPSLLGELVNALSKYAGPSGQEISSSFFQDVKGPASRLLLSYLAQATFTFFNILLLSRIGEQMACEIRCDLFEKILIQDIEFFDKNRTGELVNRLTADVQEFKSSFKQTISMGLRSAAQLVGGAISLYIISPQLATVALISVPSAVLLGSLIGRSLRELSRKSQAQAEKATNVCQEALGNVRTVRACAAEHLELMFFDQEVRKSAELSQELGTGIALFQALTNMFLNCMVLGTLYLGGSLMSDNSITAGQLMSFLVASQGVQRSLSQGSIIMGNVIRGLTAGARVFEYIAIEPKVDLVSGSIIADENLKGEIRFEGINFAYPTRPDHIVLKDFNLTLKPGQTVALVGSSGSGKSTVAALLERFYEPSSGSIYIDSVNLKEISPIWLRNEVIGYIDQQPVLFGCSIKENIRYGRQNATESEIIEASEKSQSHDFIERLPEKYATNVGERGTQLSGGQRQRIAIARALIKEPVILILDEATSALDSNSEAEVQRALDSAIVDRTTLVIAHRLSTIRNADVIVVIDSGRIREQGTHHELMKRRGLYYELVQQQERKDEEENRARG